MEGEGHQRTLIQRILEFLFSRCGRGVAGKSSLVFGHGEAQPPCTMGKTGRKGRQVEMKEGREMTESATRVHVRGPGCLLFGRLEARLAQEVV